MALFAETARAKRTTKMAQNVNVLKGGQDLHVHIVQGESGKISTRLLVMVTVLCYFLYDCPVGIMKQCGCNEADLCGYQESFS